VVNRAAGKGYENEGYYSNIQFKFCPIENIHIMRGSLQKLLDSKYEKKLEHKCQFLFFSM
jgi:myotubularin-related protein 6/7/8